MKSLNYFSNKILLIAILFISFFGMNLVEGKGQDPCAPDVGYTYATQIININGCNYTIKVCYICSPVGEYDIKMKYLGYIKSVGCVPSPPISDVDLNNILREKAKEFVLNTCGVTPCEFPEKSRTLMLFTEYICWDMYIDSSGNAHVNACNLDQKCETIYRVCRNINGTTFTWVSIQATYIGPNTLCPKLSLPPTNGNFDPILWPGCYMLNNNCFPG
jgi:hypothetical protein